ncbi:hypothetical protein LTS18_012436 [Coniosporium uncinatum]|uniref:Uncharacterized protein n=1 Tax=Coniosporium uncinatum TaxID=93489 RepID=A0ACC3CXU7_9PEZI|nr:hypothetical protein LTS18_012436 [Coniosporium uncinatum]
MPERHVSLVAFACAPVPRLVTARRREASLASILQPLQPVSPVAGRMLDIAAKAQDTRSRRTETLTTQRALHPGDSTIVLESVGDRPEVGGASRKNLSPLDATNVPKEILGQHPPVVDAAVILRGLAWVHTTSQSVTRG